MGHYTVIVKELMFFSTEESQRKGLNTLVTRDPELPEPITEGRIENWESSLCGSELQR